ncbi:paraspeckle component 1-like [Centruroides sculpturatus]|uniref:paraspeckle component 1-like n=1 Tax=Centruroides sculpturatus TaxID=218467 RepID=UPI000C6DF882|nr:paraspeckle component 1-like [Centruroides sculpturatus]
MSNTVEIPDNDVPEMKPEVRISKRDRESRDGRNNRQDRQGERDRGNFQGRRNKDPVKERLASVSGPTHNLQTREGGEPKKFTGRCRLFVGNLPSSITDDAFKQLFQPFGEIAEVFLNASKGFGFVKLDTRQNAEAAKAALDFSVKDGKALRVRFATHGAALKVKNLSGWVSNELLEAAFSIFGEVERAIVIVDDRGRPVGEGIVEYSRKQAAQTALKRCTEGCFLLTSSPRPVLVEPLEQRDEEDGLPEKNFQKNNKQYLKERDIGPRLGEPGTFEYDFATRWKQLYEVERQKRENLEKEILEARHQLEEQMEYSLYEHETNVLREKLRHMEEQSTLLQRERDIRREEERRRDEQRRQEELMLRQQQEEILRRRSAEEIRRRQEDTLMMQIYIFFRREEERRRDEQRRQEELMLRQQQEEILRRRSAEEIRRRQEDTLMMQASSLSDLLDRQEAALRQMQGSGNQGMGDHMGAAAAAAAAAAMGPGPGGPSGGSGMSGPGAMMQGPGGMGMPQRQSRFDQPPPYMGGPPGPVPGNHSNMGPPGAPPSGNMNNMRGNGPISGRGNPREMMDRRDHREDYPMENKRRRY